MEQGQTPDTSTPQAETTDVEVETQTPDTSAPTDPVVEQGQTPDTPAPTDPVVQQGQTPDTSSAVEEQRDVSDSVKRSASPKRGVSMKVDNDSNYISLYNQAIDKIFKNYNDATFTLYQDPKYFSTLDSPSPSYHDFLNPKHFKSPNSLSKSATDTCREQFLSFMSNNFPNFNNMDLVQGIPFLDIVEKVRQFINKMDVKMTNTGNNIVVTLHDIKTKYSSYNTDHCISERLFMAILLAIQMLHCPTPSPDREYTLKFKFASTLFIISSLQKSSMQCTKNSEISNLKSNDDPVAANIFDFDLRYLKPKPRSEQLKTGGSKSRRRHWRHHKSKHARKTHRRRGRKSKPKTHRRRSARHSRIRKHKKYTSRVG